MGVHDSLMGEQRGLLRPMGMPSEVDNIRLHQRKKNSREWNEPKQAGKRPSGNEISTRKHREKSDLYKGDFEGMS